VILLFAAYEVYGKTFEINAEQTRLSHGLEQQWSQPAPSEPLPGHAIARLYLPRIGKKLVVVQGVKMRDLRLSPGHYPTSQMPGELGNFAVAGHRVPSIFWDLDRMQPGDAVVVETKDSWFVYRTSKVFIVKPTSTQVVAANPDGPEFPPTESLVTLTTCNPKWDNYERLILRATLLRKQEKSTGRPSEVGGS
jgi:sortase A